MSYFDELKLKARDTAAANLVGKPKPTHKEPPPDSVMQSIINAGGDPSDQRQWTTVEDEFAAHSALIEQGMWLDNTVVLNNIVEALAGLMEEKDAKIIARSVVLTNKINELVNAVNYLLAKSQPPITGGSSAPEISQPLTKL